MQLTVSISGSSNSLKDLTDIKDKVITRLATVVSQELKSRTPIKSGNARRGWRESRSADKTVENTVPYISRLESGYSRQAPRGFVKQSVAAAVATIDKEFFKR
jgi:hypothetical protein